MRAANIVIAVLLLSAPAWLGAQAARPTTAPETFSGTAQIKNASGALSGTLEIRINRYTPDFDRKTMEEALRLGGYSKFVNTLRGAPEVGQLVLGGGTPHVIRYARERVEAGNRTIVVVTEKPAYFVGAGQSDAKPRTGFELGVVQIQMDGSGKGRGTMAGAARVRPDGDGGVLLDDYADAPIEVTNITRKPS